MNLIELFQSETQMQAVLTRIMTERCRMRYKRDKVREVLSKAGHDANAVTMGQVEALHWFLNPEDTPRVPKQNMTRPRKD